MRRRRNAAVVGRRGRRRTVVPFPIVLLLFWFGALRRGSLAEEDKQSEYLYYGTDDAFPVQDYHVPPGTDEHTARHPSFIYNPNKGPRVVEFYAPWCPHCQHFRDHYVHLAKQLTTVAKENGVAGMEVHAVSCQVHRDLCHDFNVHGYPKVYLFPAGQHNYTKEMMYWKLHPFDILNELGVHIDKLKLDQEMNPRKKVSAGENTGDQQLEQAKYKRTKQNVFDDAHLSLVFALKNGVYMSNGPLTSNTTRLALKGWLDLLKMALPPTWNVQQLVKGVLDEFDTVCLSEKHLVDVVDKYPAPPQKIWSESCTKGQAGMGYTCGLWQLFHIVTIGVVEWNMMISSDDNYELVINTEEAATTIRNFVENFFGCEVCRLNFLHAFDSCAHNRCTRLKPDSSTLDDWLQLPVWLFETHNSVNVRLLKEKYERDNLGVPSRHDEMQKEWPLRSDCPTCWNAEGGWNDLTIYKLLRTEYWPEDFVSAEYRAELFPSKSGGDDDDNVVVLPPLAFQAFTLMLIVGMAAAWYGRKVRRLRSGYHKKTDDSFVPYSNGV